jgi:hypothetical protein
MSDTSTNTDIREWLRSKGRDVSDRGPIPKADREAYQARENDEAATAFPADDREPGPDTPSSTEGVTERAPKVVPTKTDLGSRAKAVVKGARSRKGSSGARTKRATGPRASVEAILTGIYGAFAGGVGRVNPAVGYIMGVQAPVAGMLLEDTVKGTMVDRALQPFAKNADRVRVGRALLGPPVLVAFMQQNPDKAAFAMPMLRKMLADYIDLAGPKIVEIKKREEAFEEKYGAEVDKILMDLVGIINMQNQATQQEE